MVDVFPNDEGHPGLHEDEASQGLGREQARLSTATRPRWSPTKLEAIAARRAMRIDDQSPRRPITVPDDISVAIYLDTDDDATIDAVLARVVALRSLMGHGGPERDVTVERGSIFRISWAAARQWLSSKDAHDRLDKLEHALLLMTAGLNQAEYDSREAGAIGSLIRELETVPRACIRVGSLLLLKFPSTSGEPTVIGRSLTPAEIRALERVPEIQNRPEATLAALASALEEVPDVLVLNKPHPPVSGGSE